MNKSSHSSSSKEREERLKLGKEKLQNERKQKEENKRKQQEIHLNEELYRLKRKHLVMYHKLEYDLLLNVRPQSNLFPFLVHLSVNI